MTAVPHGKYYFKVLLSYIVGYLEHIAKAEGLKAAPPTTNHEEDDEEIVQGSR